MTELDRRTLLSLLSGAAAAGLAGCAPSESPRQGLMRLLGLAEGQADWLDVLGDAELEDLYTALTASREVPARAVGLLSKVLSTRSRLLAFVGYGQTGDQRTACDGLFRE